MNSLSSMSACKSNTLNGSRAFGNNITPYTNISGQGVTATYVFTLPYKANVNYLIVGGGGAGGYGNDRDGGGGGGGGVQYGTVLLEAGNYNVSVGYGGYFDTGNYRALSGGASSFNGIIALGGGWGGSGNNNGVTNGNPFTATFTDNPTIQSSSGNVASGGGAQHNGSPGIGTPGQGNNGGVKFGSNVYCAGGGGGYVSVGGSAGSTTGGDGGLGLPITSSILPGYTNNLIPGNKVSAGGGGGVQAPNYSRGGVGTSGCSGNGGNGSRGQDGTNNTGGGGGGGALVTTTSTRYSGGLGGSGIVILSY